MRSPAARDLPLDVEADASARMLHPTGRWQRSPEDERLDAALLLPAIRGAIPADDPRTRATLRAYEQEMTDDGYAYRYRPDERPLGEAEGAFLLCGFIMSLALGQQGDASGLRAGSSATVPPAVRPGSCPRSST